MPTDKQTAANRRNAQSSTGPLSPEGKARSARNALKTGIYAESLLLPDEKLEDLRALIDEYYLFHTPFSPAARAAVDNLIRAEWLARRLARIDTQIITHEIRGLWKPDPGCTSGQGYSNCRSDLQKVQHRLTATDNLYHRNLRVLQLLQPDAEPEPQSEPDAAAPPEPDFSTAQPTETTVKTPEMASFRKTTPTPANKHPLDFKECPNCRILGYRSPTCHYDQRKAS
jgi:hypothetical protein